AGQGGAESVNDPAKPGNPPPLQTRELFRGEGCPAALSADGKTLAAYTSEPAILLRDTATGKETARLKLRPDFDEAPRGLTFSPDGKFLAAGTYNSTLVVWELATQKEHVVYAKQGEAEIVCVAWSPDGKTLAAGGRGYLNPGLVLYDVQARKLITTVKMDADVRALAFAPDGKTLAVGGSELLLWDVAAGKA